MKTNLKGLLAACAILAVPAVAMADEKEWSTDFKAAAEQATAENKDMLVNFTGSDWCGWCIRLVKEVFSHQEFKDGVKDGYVLVELDYPNDKSKLSEETIAQNEELQGKYSIQGFPTILLMDGKGRPFAQTGYQEGGPEKYVSHLKELSTVREARDEAFAKAEKLEGVEKAKSLVAALEALPLSESLVGDFYGDTIEAIKASDPDDESGYVKGIELQKKFAGFQNEVNTLASTGDFKGALEYTDKVIAEDGFEGGALQQIVVTKAMIHFQLEETEKGFEALDKAEAIDSDSEFGERIRDMKAQLKERFKEAEAAE